jgi:hypothetical protein
LHGDFTSGCSAIAIHDFWLTGSVINRDPECGVITAKIMQVPDF